MDEQEFLEQEVFPEVPEVEPEDPVVPYREAGKQRRESAAIIAEHDELLADMLFEMTMKELEV